MVPHSEIEPQSMSGGRRSHHEEEEDLSEWITCVNTWREKDSEGRGEVFLLFICENSDFSEFVTVCIYSRSKRAFRLRNCTDGEFPKTSELNF